MIIIKITTVVSHLARSDSPTLLELCPAWLAVTPPTSLSCGMHGCKVQSSPTTTVRCISSLHAYSLIKQSGRSVKSVNAKNTKKIITDS